MTLLDTLKRTGEAVGATVAIYCFAAAIIAACGGSLPPWSTVAQAQTLEDSLKKFEVDQARQDKATQANIDLLFLSQLRTEAASANVRYASHPRDPQAKADAWFAQKRLDIFFKAHPNLASAMGQ